ncbi:MAG: ABC transporter substrate-binding protein [Stenomitos rutilans HA7619-LM2]|nr:ABC transporter substrate-binding protein [Stenomitos rutilans HA7619-LM2]
MKLRQFFLRGTLFVLSLLFTISCASSNSTPTASTDANSNLVANPVVLGYSNWVGWLPWAIAEEENLFAAHGANVELKWFDNVSSALEAMVTGQLDANSQTLNETVTFAPKAVNGETVVLVNDNSNGNDKIIVTQGINSVADLKGKRIGVEEGIVSDFLLSLALKENGLSRNDVQTVNLETGAATAAFSAGQLDAVVAWVPFTNTALKRNGSQELSSSKDFPGAIPDLLVVSQKLISERPDQVQAIVDTWFDTLKFIATNPERANEIMAKRAGVTIEELQSFQAGVKFFTPEENLEVFSSGDTMKHLPFAIKEISNFIVEAGFLPQVPNSDSLLDDHFIKAHIENSQN